MTIKDDNVAKRKIGHTITSFTGRMYYYNTYEECANEYAELNITSGNIDCQPQFLFMQAELLEAFSISLQNRAKI